MKIINTIKEVIRQKFFQWIAQGLAENVDNRGKMHSLIVKYYD